MAELNLLKEETLYREQMRRDLIITSGWMAGRPLSVAVLQGSYKLAKIELLVNPDQQMVGIDKIPQSPSGELEQGGVSPVPVQWLQHPSAPQQLIYPVF